MARSAASAFPRLARRLGGALQAPDICQQRTPGSSNRTKYAAAKNNDPLVTASRSMSNQEHDQRESHWNSQPMCPEREEQVNQPTQQQPCAQCGEPLLGSVNRCWRCGTICLSQTGPVDRTRAIIAASGPAANMTANVAKNPSPFAPSPAVRPAYDPRSTAGKEYLAMMAPWCAGCLGLLSWAIFPFSGWCLIPALFGVGFAIKAVKHRRQVIVALVAALLCWGAVWYGGRTLLHDAQGWYDRNLRSEANW